MIKWFQEGGFVMWLLLFISLLSWGFIFEKMITLFREFRSAKRLKQGLGNSNKAEDIRNLLEKENSAFSLVLQTIYENANLSKNDNVVLSRTQLKEEAGRLQKGLTFLEIAATISPLLGLLGTVIGMVEVFGVIAKVGVGEPAFLSGGISKALNTTVFGLIVAIPSSAAFTFYERKIENLLRGIEKSAVNTFAKLYNEKNK